MCIGDVKTYLSDEFLDRVKAAYKRAISAAKPTRGQWAAHNQRRADVHIALLAKDNETLRAIFTDPTTTDLYYGVDDLCRSHIRLRDPSKFVSEALRHDRARIGVYQITRVQQLIPDVRSVVEIGPGMGRAAYYGYLANIDYTTIDLPLGIVAQACFLGRALGPDAIWFFGEDQVPSRGRIRMLHTTPNERFDVALNVDSITEMSPAVAFRYFSWCSLNSRYFLSINHTKNNFTVSELGFICSAKSVIRCACPAWDGYVEEGFLFDGSRQKVHLLRWAAFEAIVMSRRGLRLLKRSASSR